MLETHDSVVSATQQHIDQSERWGARNYAPLPVVLTRGEGPWVWDIDGKRYLDCLAAYSAVNQGHCHPRIVKALKEQAERITLTSRAFYNDRMGPFLQQLCELTGYDKALPMNTGAEGVETAIKTARKWATEVKGTPDGESEIIVADGNFHGRTTTIVGFSTDPQAQAGFGPFTPGFKIVEYGNLEAMGAAIGPNTAAVMIEPIQGEGGVILPPDGYLAGVAALCKEHRALFIADEVQTGLGRTGKLLASHWDNVRPDMVILGKALGGGVFPVSAVVADTEILGVYKPGDHGSTFGGNPLACAVAMASLDVLVDEGLIENAAELGAWFLEQLGAIDSPHVELVRGRGLMIAVAIKPSSGPAKPFCKALMKRGILAKETHEQVIRFAPPLVVDREILGGVLPDISAVLHGEGVELP